MRSVTLRPPTMPSSLGESEILSKLRVRGGAGAHCERRAGEVRILAVAFWVGGTGTGAPLLRPRHPATQDRRRQRIDGLARRRRIGDEHVVDVAEPRKREAH